MLLLLLQIGKIEFHRLNSMRSGISAAEFLEKEPAGLARGIEMRNLTKVFSTGKGVLKNLQMATLCTAFLSFFSSNGTSGLPNLPCIYSSGFQMIVAKSIPKYVITATNHIKSKQCSQPIRIPNNCLNLAQSMGKIVCTIIIIIIIGEWFVL